jgi:hypothetical protein
MSDDSAAEFLRDQLEALLASPALARHADANSGAGSSERPVLDGDAEPRIDAQLLRDALRAGLNR